MVTKICGSRNLENEQRIQVKNDLNLKLFIITNGIFVSKWCQFLKSNFVQCLIENIDYIQNGLDSNSVGITSSQQ